MARFNYNESKNYGTTNSYFSLKDNGDKAKIRILLNNIDDIQGIAIHTIQVGDRTMDVECLRAYNEPVHNCPLCEQGYDVTAKLYIPIYDEDTRESKIWTRGRAFFQKLSSLCSHYNPLVATPFEVERCGAKGDPKTSYEFYPLPSDNATLDSFPFVDAENTSFQVKSYQELDNYLRTNTFEAQQPVQRQSYQPAPRPQNREIPTNQTLYLKVKFPYRPQIRALQAYLFLYRLFPRFRSFLEVHRHFLKVISHICLYVLLHGQQAHSD